MSDDGFVLCDQLRYAYSTVERREEVVKILGGEWEGVECDLPPPWIKLKRLGVEDDHE